MKLMIASDIHGSAIWCEKMLQAWRREAPGRLVLLGDLLYHGPRNDLPEGYAPKAVIAMLNGVAPHLLCVRGNCEAEVDQMVLSFPVMADYAALLVDGHAVYATHGHIWNEGNPPPLQPGDLLLCGHTHIPRCHRREDFTCVNPGSVSIPKQNTPPQLRHPRGRRDGVEGSGGRGIHAGEGVVEILICRGGDKSEFSI